VLRAVAAISLLYDLAAGVLFLFYRQRFEQTFGLPAATPLHADLIGIFLIAIAVGYVMPLIAPLKYRGYLWVAGVLLKTGGAAVFAIDFVYRAGPRSMLLFAFSDGVLALLTLVALLRTHGVYEEYVREKERVEVAVLYSKRETTLVGVLARVLLPFALLRLPFAKPEPPPARVADAPPQ
jgi:hypothetical protein